MSQNGLESVPSDIENLTNLTHLNLSSNKLYTLPIELTELSSLELDYNAISITDTAVNGIDDTWADTQTVPPTSLSATTISTDTIRLEWTPILFQDSERGGYYEIILTTGDTEILQRITANKRDSHAIITGLAPNTLYSIRMRTYTPPYTTPGDPAGTENQPNALWSIYSDVISASTYPPGTMPVPTNTPSPTPTHTPTPIPTHTPSPTSTATNVPTESPTASPTPSPTPTATSTPEGSPDAYEPNNNCVDAVVIEPDGGSQIHNFYNSGDVDWVQFTAPTAGIYRIEVTIPDDSRADIDLYYHTDCDSLHEDRFTETFAPGARLDVTASEVGQQFYIQLKNFDLQAGADVYYSLSVRAMPSNTDESGNKIIPGPAIVVAGRYRDADPLQENINNIAQDAYNLLKAKGRKDSEIYFLATDSSLPGYDDPATERNLELAITNWAAEQLEVEGTSRVLTLYLVDHGDRDKFYLDKDEVLVPKDLDAWLTTLEDKFAGLLVNVIIEACRAGSFIDRSDGTTISKAGRVIITSSSEDYDAYVSRHGAEFSDNLITFLHQEYNLGYSFQMSANRVQEVHYNQDPWIDANGNSTPNEPDDIAQASLRSFVESGSLLLDKWPPYIATVNHSADIQSIGTGFHAEVRHQRGNNDITAVWGIVYPPNYTLPSEDDGELNDPNLDVIEFVPESSAVDARYVEAEPYMGFTETGVYRVVIHARDINGLSARPVTMLVEVGHRIFLPTVSR
ncbi:MAG: fibronectin type III domain-containing protein [Chloroflexota bacterium]